MCSSASICPPARTTTLRRPGPAHPAMQTRVFAAVRQNARRHGFQEMHAPHTAVATCQRPRRRALADFVTLQPHGNRNSSTSGSVRRELSCASARRWCRQNPRLHRCHRDGFVILVRSLPKVKLFMVHWLAAITPSAIQRIGDAGGGFHIARHHRGGDWVQHGAGRDDDLSGFRQPRSAECRRPPGCGTRRARRHTHRGGRIEVVALLGDVR